MSTVNLDSVESDERQVGGRARPLTISVSSLETQNVSTETNGRFAVEPGAGKTGGLPQDVSSSGQARWLGISFNGGAEPPRVAPLSVPYARKAAEAETLGGLPPSAFVAIKSNEVPGVFAASAGSGKSGNRARSQASLSVATPSRHRRLLAHVDRREFHCQLGSLSIGNNCFVPRRVSRTGPRILRLGTQQPRTRWNEPEREHFRHPSPQLHFVRLAYGVTGSTESTTGIGVLGAGSAFSNLFATHAGYQSSGVVGDAGDVSGVIPIGIHGTADAGIAVIGENSSMVEPTALFVNFVTTAVDQAFEAEGTSGHCYIDTKGDLACTGSKSAIATLPNNRSMRLYAVESTGNNT